VGETRRNPELAAIVGGQARADPVSARGRRAAHIDRDVENLAGDHRDQLALGFFSW